MLKNIWIDTKIVILAFLEAEIWIFQFSAARDTEFRYPLGHFVVFDPRSKKMAKKVFIEVDGPI